MTHIPISSHLITPHRSYPWYLCCLPLFCEGTFSRTHLRIRSDFRIPLIQLSLVNLQPSYASTDKPLPPLCHRPHTHLTPHLITWCLCRLSLSFAKGRFVELRGFCGYLDYVDSPQYLRLHPGLRDCILHLCLLPYYFSASSIHGHVLDSTSLSTRLIASLFLAKGHSIERTSGTRWIPLNAEHIILRPKANHTVIQD